MCCTFLAQKPWFIHLSQNQSILEMIQTPVIVTFANQKGGVGKTTLCVSFANYLVTKGVRVVVIDCDFQHSIMKCRKADIRKYGEQEMPYEVWAYEANDKAMMTSLMEKLHNDPEIDVVLMDSPGSLKAEGLIPMLVNSDIIIVPFHYDLVTVPSTASFLMFVDRLKKAVGERMKARLFIIPNLNCLSGTMQGILSQTTDMSLRRFPNVRIWNGSALWRHLICRPLSLHRSLTRSIRVSSIHLNR